MVGMLFPTNRDPPKLASHSCLPATELPFVAMEFRCYVNPSRVYMSSVGFWLELETERKESGEREMMNSESFVGRWGGGLFAAFCFCRLSWARGFALPWVPPLFSSTQCCPFCFVFCCEGVDWDCSLNHFTTLHWAAFCLGGFSCLGGCSATSWTYQTGAILGWVWVQFGNGHKPWTKPLLHFLPVPISKVHMTAVCVSVCVYVHIKYLQVAADVWVSV